MITVKRLGYHIYTLTIIIISNPVNSPKFTRFCNRTSGAYFCILRPFKNLILDGKQDASGFESTHTQGLFIFTWRPSINFKFYHF